MNSLSARGTPAHIQFRPTLHRRTLGDTSLRSDQDGRTMQLWEWTDRSSWTGQSVTEQCGRVLSPADYRCELQLTKVRFRTSEYQHHHLFSHSGPSLATNACIMHSKRSSTTRTRPRECFPLLGLTPTALDQVPRATLITPGQWSLSQTTLCTAAMTRGSISCVFAGRINYPI